MGRVVTFGDSGRPAVMLLGDGHVGLRLAFASRLARAGHRVVIATPNGTSIGIKEPNVSVVEYPLAARRLIGSARAVIRLRREQQIDIVQAFSTLPSTVASLAAWVDRRGCYVRTVNGLGRSFTEIGVRGWMMRLGYSFAQIILDAPLRFTVFQNHDDAAWHSSTPILKRRPRQVILGSGVDVGQFRAEAIDASRVEKARSFLGSNGRATAVLVGRQMRTKGVDDLAAAGRIAADVDTVPLLLAVVGGDETNPRLAPQSTSATYGPVDFSRLGSWRDMPALFAAADVVVLPTTYREGIPRVLIEGAAMGRPLVAYDVPGCREIVEHEGNGFLIDPGDTSTLAAQLVRLLNDRSLQIRFGQRSRSLVEERFEVGIIANQYSELYQRFAR